MKKLISLILVLSSVLALVACNNVKTGKILVYSFFGKHEYFEISNGLIVMNNKEEIFEGGDLELNQLDWFADVVFFSTTFYTVRNKEKHIIMSNSVMDKTGDAANINSDLGKKVGAHIIGKKIESIDNLWFELKTLDSNGKENVYQLQLQLTLIY